MSDQQFAVLDAPESLRNSLNSHYKQRKGWKIFGTILKASVCYWSMLINTKGSWYGYCKYCVQRFVPAHEVYKIIIIFIYE